MASPLLILWIDVQNNTLLSGWESASTATLPSLKQGDSVQIEVHTVRSSNGGAYMVEVEIPQTSTLKMAIGRNEQKPSDGYLTVSYLGDSVQIPTSSTQTQVNTLINGLASITAAGGVVVTIVNGSTYRVSFNQIGARSDIACDAVNLRPTCSVSSRKIVTGSSTVREVQHIKPKVIPIAYNDVFVDAVEPTIIKTNPSAAITRFSISPQPKYGSFFISNGTLSTGSISIGATAPEIMDALEVAGLSDFNEVPVNNVYSVIKVGPFDWDITLVSGTIETLTAYDVGLIGFKSKTGIINLNNVEVEDFLAGAASASAMLELELSDDNSVQTIYQGTILVVNDLIDYQTYSPTQLPSLINDAPTDNVLYGRKNNAWSPVILDGNNIPDYNNGITYTVGNQVYYQGKLYRMITAVGGAGYDPVAYPSYWESLSGTTDLTGYATESWVAGGFYDITNPFGYLSVNDAPIANIYFPYHEYGTNAVYTWEINTTNSEGEQAYAIMAIVSPVGDFDSWNVSIESSNYYGVSIDYVSKTATYYIDAEMPVEFVWSEANFGGNGQGDSSYAGVGWKILPYIQTSTFGQLNSSILVGNYVISGIKRQVENTDKVLTEGSIIADLSKTGRRLKSEGVDFNSYKVLAFDPYGTAHFSTDYAKSAELNGKANKSGDVFTGLLYVNVDITQTAVKITQKGIGHAFVIEDSITTDTTSLVINNAGNLGLGVNPNTWVATQKFEINGSIKFITDSSVQSTAYIPSSVAITGGTIDGITIDGGTY